MKIAVNFFNVKNKFIGSVLEIFKKTFFNISTLIYVFIAIVAITFLARYIKIYPEIFNLATNFRQAEDHNMTIAELLSFNTVYNKDNYLLKKEEQKVVKASNENQDVFELIDSLAESKNDVEVLSKSPSITITAENKSLQRVSIDNMRILNYSSKRDIDFAKIINGNTTLTKKSDKVLLYNTHTSESYANSDKYKFEYSGTRRSQDANFNMLTIAKSLNENLRDKGIEGVQNTTPHDYGTYTSAYAKSRITVKNAITNMGSAGISIDVHRDAAGDIEFRPIVNVKNVQVAQLMFVMGVGNDSSKHEYWEENLRLALKIQRLADEIYPGLFRPMMIRDSVYNQDLNKYSLLVEVGATGNTIDEAKIATRCLSNLLNIIYND